MRGVPNSLAGIGTIIIRAPGEQFVQHQSRLVDITATVPGSALCLLGRQVARRRDPRAEAFMMKVPRTAEVDQSHITRSIHQHILRPDVAVGDGARLAMQVGQYSQYRQRDRNRGRVVGAYATDFGSKAATRQIWIRQKWSWRGSNRYRSGNGGMAQAAE